MGRGLQEQSRFGVPRSSTVGIPVANPAMEALIQVSTEASRPHTTGIALEDLVAEEQRTATTKHNKTETASSEPKPSTNDDSGEEEYDLAKLDPNEHARVSDPVVRPAKKHTETGTDLSQTTIHHHPSRRSISPDESPTANHQKNDTNNNIGFSESILSRLFEPDRKQKPELWGCVRLVAPGPADRPPRGQYKWRSKDAVAAYCLKCKIAFTYTPGTSKTVSRHMVAYHGLKSNSLRSSNPRVSVPRPSEARLLSTTTHPTGKTTSNVAIRRNPNPLQSQKGVDAATEPRLPSTAFESTTPTTKGTANGVGSNTLFKGLNSTRKRQRPSITSATSDENEVSEIDSDDCNKKTIASPLKKLQESHSTQEQASTKKRKQDRKDPEARKPQETPLLHSMARNSEIVTKKPNKVVFDLLCDDFDEDDEDDDGEDAFLKGHGRNRKDVISKALFRWLVGSYQILDCCNGSATNPVWGRSGSKRDFLSERAYASSSLFVDFCKTLDDSFEFPEPSVLESLATTSYEILRSEIRIHASKLFPENDTGSSSQSKSHEFVSVSVRRVTVVRVVDSITGETAVVMNNDGTGESENGAVGREACIVGEVGKGENKFLPISRGDSDDNGITHDGNGGRNRKSQRVKVEETNLYPVRLTFCTPMFRIKSYVIAVMTEEDENTKSHTTVENGETTTRNERSSLISPYSKAVDQALKIYGFPRENVSRVVVRGSCQEVEDGVSAPTISSDCLCVLDRLDKIIVKALRSPTMLPRAVRELLCQKHTPGEILNFDEKSTISEFSTIRIYEMLIAALPKEEAPSNYFVAQVLDTITPFRDAIQTLSEESFSTVGLTIPVLRRVRDILILQQKKSVPPSTNNKANNDANSNESASGAPKESLESFYRSILKDFEKTFATFLNKNPAFMWTMPLDPRLIAMSGLSKTEQNTAKSLLVEEVANIVQIINQKEQKQKQNQNIAFGSMERKKSSASTMDGIFWGEDSDPVVNDIETESNVSLSTGKSAKDYATKNVESYFNTVHSQRQVKDPLLWWNNNQNQFPELAMLARKWISASAVYGRKNTRNNESTCVITTSSSDTESICKMIFLHDNNDLI